MALAPWYKVATLRKEVREGRSFSPDEFAIALEQVVAGTAPEDYSDPAQFFSRTCFTRALKEHAGMVLRRLSGRTENTAPVLTLITQFGGGKTHTLTSLYHLANAGAGASTFPGVADLLNEVGMVEAPSARVGVFVGNAWDPAEGRETPWIDLARQLAGDKGVAALGAAAHTTPPGTEALAKVFAAADAPVLLLFDEVLNFVNRHRGMADSFHAFLQNLTVAVAGTTHAAAVISLPRSQVEMTDWDQQWQERITKVVRRVARDLIANDESEISEVVRRRLFEDIGKEQIRRKVAKTYAGWCFERTARLPAEWLAVDTATTEARAKEFLRGRFEACYPFHPATLSVFQRKWRALAQFQQTRGALAMLAQWISWAAREQFQQARTEPLITLGSAPLHVPEFRAVVLGQLGESRLDVAIDADLAGPMAHAKSLDVDATGALRDIHRRVGTAILFESSGGQVDKVAHLPELRFALGEEPDIDTATIDNAATALEVSGFFIRKVGTDGYCIHHQATLKKVVSDRRASLDEETEIKPAIRKLVEGAFKPGATLPVIFFPRTALRFRICRASHWSSSTPRWSGWPTTRWSSASPIGRRNGARHRRGSTRVRWSGVRGNRDGNFARRLSYGSPGSEWLTRWPKVSSARNTTAPIGHRFRPMSETLKKLPRMKYGAAIASWRSRTSRRSTDSRSSTSEPGHSSASETFCGRIIGALKAEALLNENVGAGYLDRHWPPTFKDTGAWPLTSLRQSFLDGSLTRLIDTDSILRRQITEFVSKGDFGLASGVTKEGSYGRLWYAEPIRQEEVAFESSVFLLTKAKVEELKATPGGTSPPQPEPSPSAGPDPEHEPQPGSEPTPGAPKTTLRLAGTVPPKSGTGLEPRYCPNCGPGMTSVSALSSR